MPVSVSVGVCAYNEGERIPKLLGSLLGQAIPEGFSLDEVLVVASGCTDGTEAVVREWAATRAEIRLLTEPDRNGKASAINRLLGAYRGDLLVLVNADAILCPGALAALLDAFRLDPALEVACGCPVPGNGTGGLVAIVQDLVWSVHNRTLEALSRRGLENHCCDELMAMRRCFATSLPPETVNDGAYLGALAGSRGQSVRFVRDARVVVRSPKTLRGLLAQRRRILAGHRQVFEMLGRPPRTLRDLATVRPDLAAAVLLGEFADRPRSLAAFLLLAVPLEVGSTALALADRHRGAPYRAAWPVVE